jgi:hypothetical protein
MQRGAELVARRGRHCWGRFDLNSKLKTAPASARRPASIKINLLAPFLLYNHTTEKRGLILFCQAKIFDLWGR